MSELPQLGTDIFYLIHFHKGGMEARAARVSDPQAFIERVRTERFESKDIVAEITEREFHQLQCRKEDRRP